MLAVKAIGLVDSERDEFRTPPEPDAGKWE
jgi:hypothetical protein